MRMPGGGRLLPGCGASGVGRSPTPDGPPSWQAAGAHYPLAVGAGGRGRGDPSATPQRALLPAGLARCGGGTRAPLEGRLLPGCGASGVGRSPNPDCPPSTYGFSSCFFPKFKIMHFQNRDIKLYTVVLLFLCFLKFLLKLCCR